MRIVSYNIQFGRGMDGIVDLARTSNVVRGADIICLQEVDQYWRRSGYRDQAAELAGLLPTHFCVYGSSFDVDASSRAAHGAVVNRRRRHGNLILSRWPILSSRCYNLPKQHYEDRFNMHMTCLEAVVDAGGLATRVYNCHAGYLDADERLTQLAAFADRYRRAPAEQGAWSGKADIDGDDWSDARAMPPMPQAAIVCGDFNAGPDSEELQRLREATGLVDCWSLADPANRGQSTLLKPPGTDIRMTGKVDHILLSPELTERVARVDIVDEPVASDHRPVQAVLDWPN